MLPIDRANFDGQSIIVNKRSVGLKDRDVHRIAMCVARAVFAGAIIIDGHSTNGKAKVCLCVCAETPDETTQLALMKSKKQ